MAHIIRKEDLPVDGIARNESMTSATSTQNSDVSGNDATDNLVQDQRDVSRPPFSSTLTPK